MSPMQLTRQFLYPAIILKKVTDYQIKLSFHEEIVHDWQSLAARYHSHHFRYFTVFCIAFTAIGRKGADKSGGAITPI
jgi:hypothetical protein